MKRKQILISIAAAVAVAALGVGGYRLYETLDAQGKRPTFDPAWQRCETSDVCVAVPAPCEDWAAVKERYRDDAAAYYAHLMTLIENTELWCPSTGNPLVTPRAECIAEQCTIIGPQW